MSEIRFDDITPIEEVVYIGGEEYILREISGDAAVRYDNARIACTVYEDGKMVRMVGLADLEPMLVSLCLFMRDGKTHVSETTIRSWPSRVQSALYARAREVSGMNESVASLERQLEVLQRQLAEARKREGMIKN